MTVGIMQPYIFPYIGYFQLVNVVDKFVFYDDVNFIKGGWINRNRILLNDKDFLFSVPLKDAGSFKVISETQIDERSFNRWKKKFYKTLHDAYFKAPNYIQAHDIIYQILESPFSTIGGMAKNSVIEIANYLDLKTSLIISSINYNNAHLKSEERVLDICKKEEASQYINVIGGHELYSKSSFRKKGIELYFLKTKEIIYRQFAGPFIPNLSIIDVLMFNSKDTVVKFLNSYELV